MDKKYIIIITAVAVLVIMAVAYFVWRRPVPSLDTKEAVISYLQTLYPELKDYPSDELPPKSIKAEQDEAGWHLAFVQEGSGVAVISARCFLIKPDRSIAEQSFVNDTAQLSAEFLVKDCALKLDEEFVPIEIEPVPECDSATGYSWCETKKKCLKLTEETCDVTELCAIENCHGLDIKCGANPPQVCTEVYQLGDSCLKHARCAMTDGTCLPQAIPAFEACKTCVENCLEKYSTDSSMRLFECESECK